MPARESYSAVSVLPIGLSPTSTAPARDVADITAALKELNAALGAPGGAGPSRKRAHELMHEKNFYLWALGAWRLSKEAEPEDADTLKDLFFDPDLTAAQALWLDDILTAMTGAAGQLSDQEHWNLLRRYMENAVKRSNRAVSTSQPSH